MKRKGFIYTLFSLFAISTILLILFSSEIPTFLQDNTSKLRVDESSNFMKSIENDFERAIQISLRRSLISIINDISDKGKIYENAENFVKELTIFGTLNGTLNPVMENASLIYWSSKIKDIALNSNYDLNIVFTNFSLEMENFSLRAIITTNFFLNDSSTLSFFNYTKPYEARISIEGLEDPLILINSFGRDINTFQKCNYTYHAKKVNSGSQFTYLQNNWTSGKAIITNNPASISNRSGNIAVTSNICSFSPKNLSALEDFEGIITEEELDIQNPCGRNAINLKNFIGGATNSINLIKNNSWIVMNKYDVWENNIKDELEKRCYFIEFEAPTFFDRVENKLNKSQRYSNFHGLASFIKISDLPSELRYEKSAIDYIYYSNTSFGQNFKIKGVSNLYPWFLMDEKHVNQSGIRDLAYN
jgi:hypothetical protein